MKLKDLVTGMGGVLLILVAISAKIIYDESQREVSYKKMTVKESACVANKYKGNNVYDCRAEVVHQDGTSEKVTLGFSVLPGDVIYLETISEYGIAKGYSGYTRHKEEK